MAEPRAEVTLTADIRRFTIGFVRLFAAMGLSDAEIARLVCVSPRTILRWRTREGICSSWRPERAAHGTVSRAAYCHCCECREAKATAMRAYRRRMMAATAGAYRSGEPYTPDEDAVVLDLSRPIVDIACQLGRTYEAVRLRRRVLRRQGVSATRR